MADPARPPQWLFDQIMKLPHEARGWALGFMCAGWLAGRESRAPVDVKNTDAMTGRLAQCDRCGCVFPASIMVTESRCIHVHDGKTCGSAYTLVPSIDTPRVD